MNRFANKAKAWLGGRSCLSIAVTVMLIAVIVALNTVVYALTNIFGLYIYPSQGQTELISGVTDEFFAEAIEEGEEVTITFCVDKNDIATSDMYLIYNTAKALADRYAESGFIKLRYMNLITQLDEQGNRIDLDRYKTDEKGKEVTINSYSVILESKRGGHKVIGDTAFYSIDSSVPVAFNGEEMMSAMISWVLRDEHPTAYFTQNHGETADYSLSVLLTAAGYNVDTVNLRKEDIPDDAGLLVISHPTSDFEVGAEGSGITAEIEKIEDYLESGGNLYVALGSTERYLPVLESFLAEWGFTVSGERDEDGIFSRDIVSDNVNSISPDGLTFIAGYDSEDERAQGIGSVVSSYGSGRVLVSEAARLLLDADKGARPLLVSSSSAHTVRGGSVSDSDGGYVVAAYNTREVKDDVFSTVLVIPTVYMTSTDIMITEGYSNKDFMYAAFNELFDSSFAPYGCVSIDYASDMLEGFTMGNARLYTALLMTLPVIVGAVGAVVLIRRKNR